MEEWLSISQLSNKTEIPESTVRRYTNKFDKFFRYEKRSRGKKYHPESLEVLNRIATLYNDELQADEIEERLARDFPFAVAVESEREKSTPIKSIERQFQEFKEQQEQFNKELLENLLKQQEYINNSIKKRDQELLKVLEEAQQTRKEIAAAKQEDKKKWWQVWKNNKKGE